MTEGNKMNENVTKFILAIILSIALQLLLAYPLMVLWNEALVPAISGVHEISWIQAWFLQVMVTLLVRSEVKFN